MTNGPNRKDKYFGKDEPVDVEAAWQRFQEAADQPPVSETPSSRSAARSSKSAATPLAYPALTGAPRTTAGRMRLALAATVIAAAFLAGATLSPVRTIASDLLRVLHLSSVEEIKSPPGKRSETGPMQTGDSPLGRLTYVPSQMSEEIERPLARKLLGAPIAEPQSLPHGYESQSVMALSEEKISLKLDSAKVAAALKAAGDASGTGGTTKTSPPASVDGATITRIIPPSVIVIYSDPGQPDPSKTAIMLAQRQQPILSSSGVDLDYVKNNLLELLPSRLREQLSIKDWEHSLPIESDPSRTKSDKVLIGNGFPGLYFSQAEVHGVTWNAGGRTFTLAASPSALSRSELLLLASSVPPKP